MATVRVTKRAVDTTPAGASTSFLWDDEVRGFGVRVTAGGVKSYIYQYRMGGREAVKKRVTIGRHGSPWTPDTARKEAIRLAFMVGQGIDPALASKERRREAVTLAFNSYADRFEREYLTVEWSGGLELASGILRRDAKPFFGATPLPTITRGQVAEFLDTLSDRPAVRRNAFAILRRLFRWAVSRGDVQASPMAVMDAPTGPVARDRVLSDDELRQAWTAAAALGYPFAQMFRLLIATGQRREEVAGLTWAELDRSGATWLLPAARAKNKQAHLVPLSPIAVSVLDGLAATLRPLKEGEQPTWPKKGLVLTTTGDTPVSGYSRAKARLDRQIAANQQAAAKAEGADAEDMPAWRVHDLRRTLATGLQRLGVRFEVTEAVLNHVSGAKAGVAGVYQRHDWKEEKRTALDAWSRHVLSLLSTRDAQPNVVQIAGRRAA